jgi:type II secretory pathway component PulJ
MITVPAIQPTRRSDPQAGYLLLEVLLALAILTMITALVFRIIQTTVRTTREVTYLESLQERVDGISELLRQNFSNLPAVAQFQTKTIETGTELVFQHVAFQFVTTPGIPAFGTVALASRPQADGRLYLAFYQEPEDAREHLIQTNQEGKIPWTPLLSDLDQVSWRFFDLQKNSWRPDWPVNGIRPALVELTFRIAGQSQAHRSIFNCPTTPVTP